MVGNCERCLSLSQYVTTAEANGYSAKSVGKITSDYTVNIDFKIVNILGMLNSLKTELETLITPYNVETKIVNSFTNSACGPSIRGQMKGSYFCDIFAKSNFTGFESIEQIIKGRKYRKDIDDLHLEPLDIKDEKIKICDFLK
ncbi:MAG TPA: hypothetical protein PK622_03975 [Saprospiraceae bacterium]|nr:hypothetical protein [Saprospiraceae bacterium]HUN15938.1 hypothetical protein [Saprospiraceae bacterium]